MSDDPQARLIEKLLDRPAYPPMTERDKKEFAALRVEAATALEAKEAEIAALRAETATLRDMLLHPDPDQEPDNVRLHREKCDAIDRALIAKGRAETAERKLAEARAALKPFTRIPLAHTDDIDDSATVFEYEGGAITLGDLRLAARAVIEKE